MYDSSLTLDAKGYMYRLGGRELLVKTFGVSQPVHDDRPEKCPILSCEFHQRGFAREYDRQRHVLTHFEGVMICPFCPLSGSDAEKTFVSLDFFKTHLTSVHNVEQLPVHRRGQSGLFTTSTREPVSQYEDGSGHCSVCSATFANAQELYEHLDDCVTRFVLLEEPSEAVGGTIGGGDHENTGLYRISEGGMREIEEAIAFNV